MKDRKTYLEIVVKQEVGEVAEEGDLGSCTVRWRLYEGGGKWWAGGDDGEGESGSSSRMVSQVRIDDGKMLWAGFVLRESENRAAGLDGATGWTDTIQ